MRLGAAPVPFFQETSVPEGARLAGWAALVHALGVSAPVRRPTSVSEQYVRRSRRQDGAWVVLDKRYWPGDTFADHLTFALRHEDIDLLILKRIFEAVQKAEMESFVRIAPSGVAVRRAWYLFEALTGRTLDADDAPLAAAVDLLDPEAYFTGKPRLSRRHRVRDNLLGTPRFCPLIRRTKALTRFVGLDLAGEAREIVGRTSAQLITRAASFMLLADSRASFAIENERPPRNRLERWAHAVVQVGRTPLSIEEIIRLHRVLVEDTRFVQAGLRRDGVFVGERDHNGDPLPEFIGARPDDLATLMENLLEANDRMRRDEVDAVLKAAATAFAFVYIHPFQDGNGRMHRCLIHHVLAERKFTPSGMVFPVSSVMLDRIDDYRSTLQRHSGPLMPFIDWRPTPERNVEVLNATADLYRYFDCTEEAEFLYDCVRRTVERDLPHEIEYLRRHDEAMRRIMEAVEMPDRLAQDLVMFVRQNKGKLSQGRRGQEFRKLRDAEVARLERIVRDAFDGFDDSAGGSDTGGAPEKQRPRS